MNMVTKQMLGIRLKQARKALNLTQEDVARLCPGMGQTRLGNYERGIREPDVETLCKLARVLKVSVADLLDEERPSLEEVHILDMFRSMDAENRSTVTKVVEKFSGYSEYRRSA